MNLIPRSKLSVEAVVDVQEFRGSKLRMEAFLTRISVNPTKIHRWKVENRKCWKNSPILALRWKIRALCGEKYFYNRFSTQFLDYFFDKSSTLEMRRKHWTHRCLALFLGLTSAGDGTKRSEFSFWRAVLDLNCQSLKWKIVLFNVFVPRLIYKS